MIGLRPVLLTVLGAVSACSGTSSGALTETAPPDVLADVVDVSLDTATANVDTAPTPCEVLNCGAGFVCDDVTVECVALPTFPFGRASALDINPMTDRMVIETSLPTQPSVTDPGRRLDLISLPDFGAVASVYGPGQASSSLALGTRWVLAARGTELRAFVLDQGLTAGGVGHVYGVMVSTFDYDGVSGGIAYTRSTGEYVLGFLDAGGSSGNSVPSYDVNPLPLPGGFDTVDRVLSQRGLLVAFANRSAFFYSRSPADGLSSVGTSFVDAGPPEQAALDVKSVSDFVLAMAADGEVHLWRETLDTGDSARIGAVTSPDVRYTRFGTCVALRGRHLLVGYASDGLPAGQGAVLFETDDPTDWSAPRIVGRFTLESAAGGPLKCDLSDTAAALLIAPAGGGFALE